MEFFVNNIKVPFSGSISLKFANPLFNDIGSYSFPISFPARIPVIQKAFGYPDKREAEIKPYIEGRIKTQFCDLLGSWGVNEAGDNINTYFKPGSGDFFSLIKDKLLSDIDFGGVKWPIGEGAPWMYIFAHLNTKMDVSYPDSDYAVYCAYMPNAVDIENPFDVKFINKVFQTIVDPLEFDDTCKNTSIYLFAGTVIDYLFSNHGYRVEENIFRKDPDFKKLTIFNTFNLRAPNSNEYSGQARIDYKDLVPHLTCGDFLKAIRDRFNIGFFINEQQKSVRIKSFDSIIIDSVRYAVCGTRPKAPVIENNRLSGINFPLNAPDDWSNHSFKSADELKNPIIVNKYRDILPETRTAGDLIFVQSESAYYRIALNDADTPVNEAQRICTDMFPYSEGDGTGEITQLSGIPAMYTHTINLEYESGNNTDVDYVVPRCDLVGNGYGQPFTEFPLMFLFARGVINCFTIPAEFDPDDSVIGYANRAAFPETGSTGIRYLAIDTEKYFRWNGSDYFEIILPEPNTPPVYTYPIGTSDVYDAEGTKISTANKALKWGGEFGLIEWLWANRINWEINIKKLIKTEMLSEDIAKLIDMDEWKRVGDDNYLVNSFEIEVEEKKVRLRNVELLRL